MKHLSGYQKRQKKKKEEEIAQSLRGSLNKYFQQSSHVNENETNDIVENEMKEDIVENETKEGIL